MGQVTEVIYIARWHGRETTGNWAKNSLVSAKNAKKRGVIRMYKND